MIVSNLKTNTNKQQGIALLVLVIAIALTISAYYFSSISIVNVRTENLTQTRIALKKAKQLLLNYAVMHASQTGVGNGIGGGDPGEYGYLPCPYISQLSLNNEGKQNIPNCGEKNINSIGYLPWISLQSEILRDGRGNCLWYAVSGTYKNATNSGLINEDTNGMFQLVDNNNNVIKGTTPEDRVVAVIFAPGVALGSQNRAFDTNSSCGRNGANATDFLEGNANTNNALLSADAGQLDQFIQASLTSADYSPPYNDYLITVTQDEIWQAVMKSDLEKNLETVAEAVAVCLAEYINHSANPNKRLPWPAPLDLTDYRISTNYNDVSGAAQGYAGRFPLYIDDRGTLILKDMENDFLNPKNSTLATGKICTNLTLPKANISNVDLTDTKNEIRIMLNNWKDHVFYAASKAYSLPNNAWTGCGTNDCISIDSTKYAAIIFFAGRKLGTQSRVVDAATSLDEKMFISNYLEDGNDVIFSNISGNTTYNIAGTNPLLSNDKIFCLTNTPNPTVIDC